MSNMQCENMKRVSNSDEPSEIYHLKLTQFQLTSSLVHKLCFTLSSLIPSFFRQSRWLFLAKRKF